MIHRPELLDALELAPTVKIDVIAWRHMFGSRAPDTENTTGARWNPAGVAAIYLSLERYGAIAEGDHAVVVQPRRPRAKRSVYAVKLTLHSVLDLTGPDDLDAVGLTMADIGDDDHSACREVGAAADWLEHDGLLVPSTRSAANTLVVYPAHRAPDARFTYGKREEV